VDKQLTEAKRKEFRFRVAESLHLKPPIYHEKKLLQS